MSLEANKAILARYFDEFWCKGNADAADGLVHPDIFYHQMPEGLPQGIDGIKALVGAWRQGFPDMHETVEMVIAEGDRAMGRFRLRGTHGGDFFGIAATGRPVEITGIDVLRIADGKIAEIWTNEDTYDLYRQIGVIEG
ncbi:MAG: ester cyclase [Alphaproteobacteria bacterium]